MLMVLLFCAMLCYLGIKICHKELECKDYRVVGKLDNIWNSVRVVSMGCRIPGVACPFSPNADPQQAAASGRRSDSTTTSIDEYWHSNKNSITRLTDERGLLLPYV